MVDPTKFTHETLYECVYQDHTLKILRGRGDLKLRICKEKYDSKWNSTGVGGGLKQKDYE